MTGIEPLLFGAAASGGAAATAGLIGTGGAFAAGSALGTLGTALSAVATLSSAASASSASDFNARVAERDAIISRQNASAQADREDRLARMRAGSNRAARGASGGTAAGSALDIMEDNALEEELNIRTILQQGELRGQGYDVNAGLSRSRASSQMTSGFTGAGSQLLLGTTKRIGRDT